jgi:uncharacterized protein (TIGR00725 family)
MNRKIQVAIVGDYGAGKKECDFAYEAGKVMAERDLTVLTGGKGGVMEAAGKGALEKGGRVVGILPSAFPGESNEYCSIRIATGLGHGRNAIIASSADIIVAIGGRAGTLTEIAFGWVFDKPIIAVKGFGGWSEELAGKIIDDRNQTPIYAVSSLQDLISTLDNLIKKIT